MSYLVGDSCISSQALATDLFYSSVPPSVVSVSGGFIETSNKKTGVGPTGWQRQTVQCSGASSCVNVASVELQAPELAVCDQAAAFREGVELGWLVALVFIGCFGLFTLQRILK